MIRVAGLVTEPVQVADEDAIDLTGLDQVQRLDEGQPPLETLGAADGVVLGAQLDERVLRAPRTRPGGRQPARGSRRPVGLARRC